ncbi:hemolysin-III channel protein [Colletotrichum tofieldiae]|nr:hemolysin-III channel protein [Colletotrichum tofieldiae]
MAAILSTSALRRRLRTAIDSDPSGRRLWSWGNMEQVEEKAAGDTSLLSWEELLNIYSHVFGTILFVLLPFYVFDDGIPPRWDTASTADVVVCSVYALGVTTCFVLSTAEAAYLSGIKADFHGVLALMWSSVFPLAHYVFPCSPYIRDAYISLTGLLAALCAAATAGPDLGAVDLGHHRAALFGAFGLAAFVLPLGHGAAVDGVGEVWERVGGGWVLATAGCNLVAILVYWSKMDEFPERWFPKTFDLLGASHQIMHIMVLAAALAYAKAVVVAFDYRHGRGLVC